MVSPIARSVPDAVSPVDSADRLADAISRAIEARPRKAWYNDPSLIISSAAFLASIVTSGISIVRSENQDVNAKKDALHAIIQQYENNLIHSMELNNKENNDLIDLGFDFTAPPDKQNFVNLTPQQILKINDITNYQKGVNANVAFENLTLAKQSLALVNELSSAASSVDLGAVAFLLFNNGVQDFPERLYQDSIDKAGNSVEYLGATRGLAQSLFVHGRPGEARAAIDLAIKVFEKFPKESNNTDNVHSTHFQTYVFAVDYIGAKDCNLAREYIASAKDEARQISGFAGYFYAQLNQSETLLAPCPPVPGSAAVAK